MVQAMALLWDEAMSVNDSRMDSQHRKLLDVINQLDVAMRAGKGHVVLVDVLNRLLAYALTHFAHEERLMEAVGHAPLACHRGEHRELLARVIEYRRRLEDEEIDLPLQVAVFLREWLVEHIMRSDRAYAAGLLNRVA
jgi:hemerythrin-like metal-binding protein